MRSRGMKRFKFSKFFIGLSVVVKMQVEYPGGCFR